MDFVFRKSFTIIWIVCLFFASSFSSCVPVFAAEEGSLRGTVRDPLGAVVAGAIVELLNGTSIVKKTTTDGTGSYTFDVPENARYSVRAVAATFQTTTSESLYLTK